jgi:hypothetical protein
MSIRQRFLQAIFGQRLAEEMETESRSWMVQCNACALERSVWEMGGVRWKAFGRPARLMRCPQCRRITWHTLRRRQVE